MLSPRDFVKYAKKLGRGLKPAEGMIICYDRRLMEYILAKHRTTKIRSFYGEMYLIKDTQDRVGVVGKFGIGSPIVVVLVEELIAFGAKRFISIGVAGSLQKDLKIGDIIVCDRAIRDEGTSYHYFQPSKYAYASKQMTERIEESLTKHGQKYIVGTTWTIDAPYRETVAEARHYQKEGVATVEMEASALFSVAKYRNVEMGAIFTISDSLADLVWNPKFHLKRIGRSLETLYKVAVDALLKS